MRSDDDRRALKRSKRPIDATFFASTKFIRRFHHDQGNIHAGALRRCGAPDPGFRPTYLFRLDPQPCCWQHHNSAVTSIVAVLAHGG